MSGCSSSEVGSVKTYLEKVTTSYVFIRINFEVCQTSLLSQDLKRYICSLYYSTSECSNHDLPLIFRTTVNEILLDLENNLGFYNMSWIINIYSRRCTFSPSSVTSNLPTFKDIINPYNCLFKKSNFSVKTSNKYITSCIIK